MTGMDRNIELTDEAIAKMHQLGEVMVALTSDLRRQQMLCAYVLTRSITDDELWKLVLAATHDPLPDDEDLAEFVDKDLKDLL